MSFRPARERDAWFTIRGFVYQVELTIDRWLDLEPTEALELERGEDIDIVANWTISGDSAERLLEQVKHRDASITLNSSEARSALANFIEHRNHNPEVKIRFRFVTTAPVGRERDPAMARGMTGIDAWDEIRSGDPSGSGCLTRLAALRRLLLRASKPQDVPVATWGAYRAFLQRARCAQMLTLVASFEWSTGQLAVADCRHLVESRLQDRNLALNPAHARQLYNQLFVHVFHALSAKGRKSLTAADRDAVLAAAAPGADSERILARISDALRTMQQQIDAASSRLDDHETVLVALGAGITKLSVGYGMTSSVTSLGAAPDLLPPVAPVSRALRWDGVKAICEALQSHVWVAVHGTSGSGKSELALQVTEARTQSTRWIALRDLDVQSAAAQLVAGLSAIAKATPSGDRAGWYDDICTELGEGGILVVDDLPYFSAEGTFGRELMRLAEAFQKKAVKLLTTSPHRVPPRVESALGSRLGTLVAPAFNDEDTRALLNAFGATDDSSAASLANFVTRATGGHAELVVTAAAFLRQRAWRFSEQELQDLLGRNYTSGIQLDVMRRVVSTVPNKSARDLLFRASLFVGSFSREDLVAIAASGPPIVRPIEALTCLEGLWIQVQGGERFAVCPLVKGFESELESNTRQSVHNTIGTRIMRRGTIGPLDVRAAIAHFLSAQKFERAGVAYLMALNSLDLTDLPTYDAGLLQLWAGDPLPAQISRAVRVSIRTLQVAVHERMGRDLSFIIGDLFALAEGVPDSEVSSLVPLVPRMAVLARFDFARTSAQLVRVLRAQDRLVKPDGGRLEFPSAVRLDGFLWHLTAFVRSEGDVRTWLEAILTLEPAVVQAAAIGVAYEMGCIGLCDRIWMLEADKEEEAHSWEATLALLTEVERTARNVGLDLLVATAQRAQVVVVAEFMHDFAAAEALALGAVRDATDPRISFLLMECLGRQYLGVGRHAEAVDSLRCALANKTAPFELSRMYAHLALSKALSATAPVDSLREANKGVALARVGRGFPQTELVKALCEAAIATHRAHGPASAFTCLDEAALVLFASRTDSASWKDLVVLFTHTVVFLNALATTGSSPVGTTADGEDYGGVDPGLFLTYQSQRHKLFTPQHECQVYYWMATFADTVGAEERLCYWQEKGRHAAIAVGQTYVLQHLNLFRITQLVAEGDHFAAIRSAADGQDSAAGIAVLSLTLAIASTSLVDRAAAALSAANAAKLMLDMAPASTEGSLWHLGASALDEGFKLDTTASAILETANQPALHGLVRSALRLMAAARDDVCPVTAAQVHIECCITTLAQREILMHMHRRLLLPFLSEYWVRFAGRSGFLLRTPAMTRAAIARAVGAPVDIRAQSILREVVWGLGATSAPEVRQWLNEAERGAAVGG